MSGRPRAPLWLRALLVTLLFPGMVAGMVPALLSAGRWRWALGLGAARWLGLALLAAGLVLLGWTIRDFAVLGHGTLAPFDAPTALVRGRLYRWVRNPMFLGVLACVLGQGLLWHSGGILLYGLLLAIAFHLRVVRYEEPVLRRQFGAAYERYLSEVPRWLPRPPRAG